MKRLTSGDAGLAAEIQTLEMKLADIRIKLFGDRRLGEVDKDAEPGLVERVSGVVRSHWRSTAAPTLTQRSGYEIVAEEFKPLLDELRKIVEIDVKKIEKLSRVWAPPRLLAVCRTGKRAETNYFRQRVLARASSLRSSWRTI